MSSGQSEVSLSPFGPSTQKYWDKRHSYFSKWDEGIQTDGEGLFSVKPERFALEIADKLKGHIVLDAFCGIGGSAIGFARRGKRVITVDTDRNRLAMAMHNARIYDVGDRIDFLHGDIAQLYDPLYDTFKFTALHIDPPWGGPDYSRKDHFVWDDFKPNPLVVIKKAMAAHCSIAIGLPINFLRSCLNDLPENLRVESALEGDRHLFDTAYHLT